MERLQRLQNRLIRAVKRLKFRASTTSARSQLHWLPVRERITFKLATLTYNARNIQQSAYIAELLSGRVQARPLRSIADRSLLFVPRTWTARANRAFNHAAPVTWNSLPQCIRERETLHTFKKDLKSFLFI